MSYAFRASEVTVATWVSQHPAEYQWMLDRAASFEFAASVLQGLRRYGRLTDGQLAAVQRCINRPAAPRETVAVSAAPVEAAFQRAHAAGLQSPKLRLGEFVFSLAPATGKNPGAVYVKDRAGEYLGKVLNGGFMGTRSVTPEVSASIAGVMADPASAAIAYGKRWGKCSICNRDLTDPESIERGIGPVCAERFGFGG
jgi:Family of unknown function (DUF6011)